MQALETTQARVVRGQLRVSYHGVREPPREDQPVQRNDRRIQPQQRVLQGGWVPARRLQRRAEEKEGRRTVRSPELLQRVARGGAGEGQGRENCTSMIQKGPTCSRTS